MRIKLVRTVIRILRADGVMMIREPARASAPEEERVNQVLEFARLVIGILGNARVRKFRVLLIPASVPNRTMTRHPKHIAKSVYPVTLGTHRMVKLVNVSVLNYLILNKIRIVTALYLLNCIRTFYSLLLSERISIGLR